MEIDSTLRFEWDEDKNRMNIRKHKVSFEKAIRVFFDENAVLVADPCVTEERWDVIGLVDKVLFVVYTERAENVIRIISARPATKEEINGYKNGYLGRC